MYFSGTFLRTALMAVGSQIGLRDGWPSSSTGIDWFLLVGIGGFWKLLCLVDPVFAQVLDLPSLGVLNKCSLFDFCCFGVFTMIFDQGCC